MISENKLNKFKEYFLNKQSEILKSSSMRAAETVDVGGDEVDLAATAIISKLSDQLSRREIENLSAIGKCLTRLTTNTYGYCEDCEEEIAEKRLEAMPFTVLCISCAEAKELLAKIGFKEE